MEGATAPSPCSACSDGQYTASECSPTHDAACDACAGLPPHAAYTGAGSTASTCPWVCDAGYHVEDGLCVSGRGGVECPANSTAPPGSPDASACVCDAGFHGPTGGPCVQCPGGLYCPGATAQIACAPGSFCPPGSANQTLCPAGHACPDPTRATACASGSFCPSGSSAEAACGAGSYCASPSTQVLRTALRL